MYEAWKADLIRQGAIFPEESVSKGRAIKVDKADLIKRGVIFLEESTETDKT